MQPLITRLLDTASTMPAIMPGRGQRVVSALIIALMCSGLSGCRIIHHLAHQDNCPYCQESCGACSQTQHPGPVDLPLFAQSDCGVPCAPSTQMLPPVAPTPGSPQASQHFPPEVPPVPSQQMQSQFMNDSLAATCASKQAELQKQANQLQDRLADIEQSLIEERQTNDRMAQSLASVNTHVEQLSQEVTFWRGEVRRIEDDAKRNHESDIAALDALASLVEQVPSPDSAADAIRQLPPAQE